MPQSNKKFLTAVVSLVLICAVTILTYAWFAGIKDIGSVNFSPASNAGLPELIVWRYYSSENDGDGADGWREFEAGKDPTGMNEYLVIPGLQNELKTDSKGETMTEVVTDADKNIVYEEDGVTPKTQPVYSASYVMESLHFGKVDNLVTLNNDNKLMLRFYFNEEVLNNRDGIVSEVKFTLQYDSAGYAYADGSIFDSIHLVREADGGGFAEVNLLQQQFDSAGNGRYVIEFRKDEPRAMQFLQIRYAISTDGSYAPSDETGDFVKVDANGKVIDTLDLSNVVPINCGSDKEKVNGDFICDKCGNGTCGVANVSFQGVLDEHPNGGYMIKKEDVTDESDAVVDPGYNGFYVYIELAPLLDAFGMQENILDYFVPAFMYFDVKLDVEIQ